MIPYSDQDRLDISKEPRDFRAPTPPLPSPSPPLPPTHIYHRNLGRKTNDRQSFIR